MENIKPFLAFIDNLADEEIGLGDAGIETYKSAPFAGVARECGQNSADARMGDKIVRLDFDLVTVPTETFPDIAVYRKVISACKPGSGDSTDKDHQFFTQAERVLAQPALKILRIADFNTQGLKGPARQGTPFHALVKSYGVNNKQDHASGGSFGIGKNAVFALSDIQTVFYSTLYHDDETGEQRFLAQGKTILVSHEQDGIPKRGTGYWGMARGFMPVESADHAPEWLVRKDIGTSIFAVGLRDESNWAYRIAASLVRNFFCAIHRGRMEFGIDNDAIVINSSTIGALFEDKRLLDTVRETGEEEDFMYSKNLYECLVSTEATEEKLKIDGFGGLNIRLLVREGLPKGVCFIRNGMVITTSLEAFGQKFQKFKLHKDFIAVIEPAGDKESAFLKSLENPAHDRFSAQGIPDPDKRHRAEKIMKEVAGEIRRVIKKEALPEIDEESDLDEMGEFFGDDSALERIDPQGEEAPQTYKPAPVQKKTPSPVSRKQSKDKGGTGGGADFEPAETDNGVPMEPVGEGSGTGAGDGGKGGRVYTVPADLSDFRNYIPKGAGGMHRRLIFTPNVTGKGKLHLMAAGLYDTAPLSIEKTDNGTTSGGGILVDFVAGKKIQIDAVLSEDFDGPIEALATAEVVR